MIPRGRALGYTLTLPEQDKFLMTREELRDELAMLMGGRVAEEIVIGDITTGAPNDIERATKVARQMVTEYGMSDTLGPLTLGQKQGEVFLGRDFGSTPDYSDAVAFEIDNEVRRLIDEAHDVALEILQENRRSSTSSRRVLIEKETLDREEVEKFFGDIQKRLPREAEERSAGLAVHARREEATPPVHARDARRPRSRPRVDEPRSARRIPRMPDRWATFDCYGTLIDWMGGIRATLAELWPEADAEVLLAAYHRIEPAVQAGRGIPYRKVMAESLAQLATEEGLVVPPGSEDALGESLPSWPPFPEVPASLDGAPVARLAARHPVEHRPGLPGRVARRDRRAGRPARHRGRDRLVQAGARSLGVVLPADAGRPRAARPRGGVALPRRAAGAELGLPCVWINRQDEVSDLPRAAELPTIEGLPTSSTNSSRPATGSIDRDGRDRSTTRRSSRACA